MNTAIKHRQLRLNPRLYVMYAGNHSKHLSTNGNGENRIQSSVFLESTSKLRYSMNVIFATLPKKKIKPEVSTFFAVPHKPNAIDTMSLVVNEKSSVKIDQTSGKSVCD